MNNTVLLLRRYGECAGFVLLWMAIEHGFHLNPIPGQLIGIPLMCGFQLLVARRPIAQLWAFDAGRFRLDRRTLGVAAALVAVCGGLLAVSRWPAPGRDGRWELLALVVASALPAAFALRAQTAANLRRAVPFLLGALALRVAWYVAWRPGHVVPLVPIHRLPDFAAIWVCEFVALFLVDEVAFRGALDPHLAAAGKGPVHATCSAVFISLLWSCWHLPAYNPDAPSFFALFGRINLFSVGIVLGGILLSFVARRSRTLVPSAAMHAFGNAHVLTAVP
jgi:membrane protease YdiL (CAAX protease family)